MANGVELRHFGHSRSTRATRGEPRPVHITLIATCRVHNSRGSIVIPSRGVTPGLSPGPWRLGLLVRRPCGDPIQRSSESVSRDLGRCLSCASAGPLRSTRAALLVGLLTRVVLSESAKSESALTGFFWGQSSLREALNGTRPGSSCMPSRPRWQEVGSYCHANMKDRRDHDESTYDVAAHWHVPGRTAGLPDAHPNRPIVYPTRLSPPNGTIAHIRRKPRRP